jgi:hypothetical protein
MTSPGLDILTDMTESQGDPRDLTHQQIPLVRDTFEDESGMGLWLFAKYICGCKDITTELHWEECVFLSRWGYIQLSDGNWHKRTYVEGETVVDNWRRLHLCVPRDTFKTTLGTRACGLWNVIKDPEITLGIFNEAEAKSKSWVGSIKQVIERSRLLHVLWPHVLPPGVHFNDTRSIPRTWKWGDQGLLLFRDSLNVSELTVEPFGIGGASTGKHFTHKILDDIIGEKSSDSPAVMQDAINWIDHSRALERPSDRGCELVNYTRWAYYDAYKHQLVRWAGDYKIYHRALLENPDTGEPDVIDGVSIFPERFPTDLCKKMYEDDPFVFASQRQCIPQAGRDMSFDKAWARFCSIQEASNGEWSAVIEKEFYEPTLVHADVDGEVAPNLVPLSWMDKCIILDPAPPPNSVEIRQQPRARNGIVVLGMDPWGRKFHLDCRAIREDPVVVLEVIVQLATTWGLYKIAIEEVNFSAVYRPLWDAIVKLRFPDIYLAFQPVVTRNKDKDTRIRSLIPHHKEGLWYYNREMSKYTLQELLEYPHGETRDLIDAEAYADQVLLRPESPDERTDRRWRTHYERAERDQWTGY